MRSTDWEHGHTENAMHMSHGMPPKTAAAHMGHDQHDGHSVAMFRDKFWLTLILMLPVVAWSGEFQHWLGYTAPTFPASQYIPAFLGTVVFLCGGSVFIPGAWGELADRQPGMMTLISLGIVVAFAASLAATFGFFQIDVWWEVDAHHHHAPWPLAGDEGDCTSKRRSGRAGRFTPGQCRAQKGVTRRKSSSLGIARCLSLISPNSTILISEAGRRNSENASVARDLADLETSSIVPGRFDQYVIVVGLGTGLVRIRSQIR